MGSAEWALVWVGVVTVVVTLYGFYMQSQQRNADLRQKAADTVDSQQAELIKDLYDKHSADAERLIKLELFIGSELYKKGDVDRLVGRVDASVDKLENTCQIGFKDLSDKFNGMLQIITGHVLKERFGKDQ